MMILTPSLFPRLVQVISAFSSIYVLVLIHRYLSTKVPGLQTILDEVIKDCIVVFVAFNIVSVLVNLGPLVYGDFSLAFAKVLVLIFNINLSLLIALTQAIIIAKGILIFHGEWIAIVEDGTMLWLFRMFTVIYAAVRFLMDFLTEPKTVPLLKLLSGTDEKRFVYYLPKDSKASHVV